MLSHRGWGKSPGNKCPHPELRSLRSLNSLALRSPPQQVAEEVEGSCAYDDESSGRAKGKLLLRGRNLPSCKSNNTRSRGTLMTGTRLAGRRAIITGAASGIGAACADLFAQEGAIVLAVDLETAFAQARANCNAAARGVHLLAKSVADSDAPEKIIAEALSVCGGVDILMNNAGIGTNALAEQMSDDVWQRTMDINVTAQFRLCRAAIPHLKESKAGRIINVASVMAEGTDYGLAAYCASKAGVAGLTRTLALELGKFGITANYILPGAISTGMTRPLWDARPEIRDVWAKKSPLRRVGEPIDIARGALFLASDDGGFVTGHGLNVDGGLMLRV